MQPRINHGRSDTMRSIYTMGFVFSMALALPLYINSSFLNEFLSDKSIGIMYTLGSIISFFMLIAMPKILSRFGNYKTTLAFTTVTAALMFALASFTNLYIVAPVFILYLALLTLILFNFDIFLEKYSGESETGSIRGTFLTITNLAILASPIIAGAILTNGDYWKIYLVGAIFMSGLILLLTLNFKNFKDPIYEQVPFMNTAKVVWKDKGMRSIFAANLILRLFYAWMTIYTPLYLHEHIGFEWSQIGIIFTIMLIPFVLL
ncbi:MFS transporter, partial [Patescibacteria group bacterium]